MIFSDMGRSFDPTMARGGEEEAERNRVPPHRLDAGWLFLGGLLQQSRVAGRSR